MTCWLALLAASIPRSTQRLLVHQHHHHKTIHPVFVGRSMARFASASGMVDFDANLLHDDLRADLDGHVERAMATGVSHFVVPGCTLADSRGSLELSRTKPGIVSATCGVHPYNTQRDEFNDEARASLAEMVVQSECRAVGETGLDYSDGFPNKAFQLPWFRFQVDLAVQNKLPLFLHVREAREDFISVLKEKDVEAQQGVRCVVHCFTGEIDELQDYVRMNFYIGLTGYIFKLPDKVLASWLELIPRDRLLIETDSPYMGFKNCRAGEKSKKNAKYPNPPCALIQVADKIASILSIPVEDLQSITTANALRFLAITQEVDA